MFRTLFYELPAEDLPTYTQSELHSELDHCERDVCERNEQGFDDNSLELGHDFPFNRGSLYAMYFLRFFAKNTLFTGIY